MKGYKLGIAVLLILIFMSISASISIAQQGGGGQGGNTGVVVSGTVTANDCVKFLTSTTIADAGAACGSGGGGGVSTVANSDGTLTISPTTGSVVASIALGHANTWTGLQTFGTEISIGGVTPTGATGTGALVFGTSPTFTTGLSSPAITDSGISQYGVLFAGSGGLLSGIPADFYYNDAGYDSLPTLQLGVRGSQPIDAHFEVYGSNDTSAHFHNVGTTGTGLSADGGIISLSAVPTGAALGSGVIMGTLQFGGSDSTSDTEATGAIISAWTTQAWTSSAFGSQLKFYTTPNNSTTLTQALLLDQNQVATFAQPPIIPQTGFLFGNNTTATTVATAAQLGALLNIAQYAQLYSNGTSAAALGLAAPTTNGDWFTGYHITGSAASAPVTEELVASTTNSVGLTVTPTYNATGPTQRFEITGSSYTGNAATATGINGNGTANQVWGMNSGGSAQGWQTSSGGGITVGNIPGGAQTNTSGLYSTTQTVWSMIVPWAGGLTIPVNGTSSGGTSYFNFGVPNAVPPAVGEVLTIYDNSTSIGTITCPASTAACTFAISTAYTVPLGHTLSYVAQSSPDGSAAGGGGTIFFTH